MHFVLDHNFPRVATGFPWPPPLRLSPLAVIAPDLIRDVEDWQVLLSLAQRGDVDGFVTNDAKMLNLSREMVVLHRARLILVVTDGVGDDPISATGLLMAYLPQIAKRDPGGGRVYVLRPSPLTSSTPGQLLDRIARRRQTEPQHLISEELRTLPSMR